MRTGTVKRKTGETDVLVDLNIDGTGKYDIDTSIPFLNHMLSQVSLHGVFDLTIKAAGDTEIDCHHTVEDIGITFGEAFKKAIGKKENIKRYASVSVPLNESLASVVVDICNRPFLVYNVPVKKEVIGQFDVECIEEFFHAFTNHSGLTLHINLQYGTNVHHIIEAIFKAFGKSLGEASVINERIARIPSTKGTL